MAAITALPTEHRTQIRPALRRRDLRRWRRVAWVESLRYLDPSGIELDGQMVDASAGGIRVRATHWPDLGNPVVLYTPSLGRLAGKVMRFMDDGFAVELDRSPSRRERLADRLTALTNRHLLANAAQDGEAPAANDHDAAPQIFPPPSARPRTVNAQTYDGRVYPCVVIEASLVGLRLAAIGPRPPMRASIRVGLQRGVVARLFDGGFAVDFRPT